jgi:predicted  nucleic acid-binding Zn-ribbon protein
MALSLADLEDFDVHASYNNRIEVFQNYTGENQINPLENAYQGLLEQRNTLLIPIADEKITITEDDLLVNKNLQTSSLFNRLNEEFKQKQIKLEECNSQLQTVTDIQYKIMTNVDNLKKVYMSNAVDAVDSLTKLHEKINDYFKETNPGITDIIRKKIATLEGEIDNISNKLNALRSLIVTGVNQIVKDENKEKKMCPVCFDNEVNTALVPCGHTYCKGCSEADRSRYAKCPQCRQQINARVKIFFSI